MIGSKFTINASVLAHILRCRMSETGISFDYNLLRALLNDVPESKRHSLRELIVDTLPNVQAKANLAIFDAEYLDYMSDADVVVEIAIDEVKARIDQYDQMLSEISNASTSTLYLKTNLEQFQVKKQLSALEEKKKVLFGRGTDDLGSHRR